MADLEPLEALLEELKNNDVEDSRLEFLDTQDLWDVQEVLERAAEYGRLNVVKKLLPYAHQVIPSTSNQVSGMALCLAAKNDQVAVAKMLIEKMRVEKIVPDIEWDESKSVLHWAAKHGRTEIIQPLLAIGVDVNLKKQDDETPLHLAAKSGHIDAAVLLIKNKANLNIKTLGKTALMYAVVGRYNAVAQTLIQAGADVNVQDDYSPLPPDSMRAVLHWAAEQGDTEMVQSLINAKAKLNLQDSEGKTPLMLAVMKGKVGIVEKLIEAKADLNVVNKDGMNVLHVAAQYGRSEIVKKLLAKGMDVNAKDHTGRTALHLAARNGRDTVVSTLLETGVDLKVKDKQGYTALDYAKELQHTHVAQAISAKTAPTLWQRFKNVVGSEFGVGLGMGLVLGTVLAVTSVFTFGMSAVVGGMFFLTGLAAGALGGAWAQLRANLGLGKPPRAIVETSDRDSGLTKNQASVGFSPRPEQDRIHTQEERDRLLEEMEQIAKNQPRFGSSKPHAPD